MYRKDPIHCITVVQFYCSTGNQKRGTSLLNICKSNNLLILNGRCHKDEGIGKYTFRDISVIGLNNILFKNLKHDNYI